jgi:hypothetical protein
MNYKIQVELGFWDEGTDTANCSQETFYISCKDSIDFKYIKRLVYQKCGDYHDTLDIIVERMVDIEKF